MMCACVCVCVWGRGCLGLCGAGWQTACSCIGVCTQSRRRRVGWVSKRAGESACAHQPLPCKRPIPDAHPCASISVSTHLTRAAGERPLLDGEAERGSRCWQQALAASARRWAVSCASVRAAGSVSQHSCLHQDSAVMFEAIGKQFLFDHSGHTLHGVHRVRSQIVGVRMPTQYGRTLI